MTGIQIFRTEIDFRIDSVLDRKIDALKKHGIGDINMDDSHRWFLLTPPPLPSPSRGQEWVGVFFYIMLYG
jgi:hypothetical protein